MFEVACVDSWCLKRVGGSDVNASAGQWVLQTDEKADAVFALGWCFEEVDLRFASADVQLAWDTYVLSLKLIPFGKCSNSTYRKSGCWQRSDQTTASRSPLLEPFQSLYWPRSAAGLRQSCCPASPDPPEMRSSRSPLTSRDYRMVLCWSGDRSLPGLLRIQPRAKHPWS